MKYPELKAQWYYLRKLRWPVWTAIVLVGVQVIVWIGSGRIAAYRQVEAPSGFELLGLLMHSAMYVIVFALAAAAAAGIAGEYTTGALQKILVGPVKRGRYLTSRAIVLLTLGLALLCIALVSAILITIPQGNLHGLREGEYIIISTAHLWWNLLIAFGVSAVAMLAVLSFGMFWAAAIRSAAASLILTFGLLVVGGLLYATGTGALFGIDVWNLLFYCNYPFRTYTEAARGLPITWGEGVWSVVLGSAAYTGIFGGGALGIFSRIDLIRNR
ncbi:MAG: hypothetical protein MAGBODY4_01447 [Candidatus Marinimicrobia bacterium]|nr:hypothetical protein [Candidatus Neomarinimicrobiota bacterium]